MCEVKWSCRINRTRLRILNKRNVPGKAERDPNIDGDDQLIRLINKLID